MKTYRFLSICIGEEQDHEHQDAGLHDPSSDADDDDDGVSLACPDGRTDCTTPLRASLALLTRAKFDTECLGREHPDMMSAAQGEGVIEKRT